MIMIPKLKAMPMVESVESYRNGNLKVTIDERENGMWFRSLLEETKYRIEMVSNSNPIYWLTTK